MSNYNLERKLDKEKAQEVGDKISMMHRKYSLEKYFNDHGIDYDNGAASCPFHSDSTPSLKFDTDRNIFKCFACGRKGGYIKFIELYENYINDTKKTYYDVMDDLIQQDEDLKSDYGSIFYYEDVQIQITPEELLEKLNNKRRKPQITEKKDLFDLVKQGKKLSIEKQLELCVAIQNDRPINIIEKIVNGEDINNVSLMDLLRD